MILKLVPALDIPTLQVFIIVNAGPGCKNKHYQAKQILAFAVLRKPIDTKIPSYLIKVHV